MKILPISEARAQLSDLVDDVDRYFERVVVTKSGHARAVIMSSQEFEEWQETIEILSNKATMKALRQAEAELENGEQISHAEMMQEL